MRVLKANVLVAFLLLAFFDARAGELPVVGYCDGCSAIFQWRSAAERSSFKQYPLYVGAHEVYVVDRVGESIRAFSVRRWFQDTGTAPRSNRSAGNRATSQGYYHAEAAEIPADPELQQALLDALVAAKDIGDVFGAGLVPIDRLGLFGQIPSAIDLVGPAGSDAGLNRMALRNELEVYVNSVINGIALQLYDLAQMALSRFLSDSSVTWFGGFVITFPDGTSIRVNLNNMRHIPGAGDLSWAIDVEILEYTAMGGGLSSVPSHPGHFSNFSYQGDGDVVGALIRLADRYGIPIVTSGPGGGPGGQRFHCDIIGDEVLCEVTGSR